MILPKKSLGITSSAVLLTFASLPSGASAAVVTAVGSIQDNAGGEVTGWQDTSIPKTMDIDGDNAYGTIYADNPHTDAHGATGAGSTTVGLYLPDYPFEGTLANYFVPIDSPDGPVGTPKTMEGAGIVYTNNAPLTFDFTLTGPDGYYADKTVRMGFMYDIAEPGRYGADFTLGQTDGLGISASLATTTSNDNYQGVNGGPVVVAPDMYFFDITGAESGQEFTVTVSGASDGVNYFSGYTMDVATIPEPGSAAMLALGAVGLAAFRRRRN